MALDPKTKNVSCVFLGPPGVGKTSFIDVLLGESLPGGHFPTEGIVERQMRFSACKDSKSKREPMVLTLVDVGGHCIRENFQSIVMKAMMLVLVYDVDVMESFEKIVYLARMLKTLQCEPFKVFVLGLQTDRLAAGSSGEVSFFDVYRETSTCFDSVDHYRTSCSTGQKWIRNEFKTLLLKYAFLCRCEADGVSIRDVHSIEVNRPLFSFSTTAAKRMKAMLTEPAPYLKALVLMILLRLIALFLTHVYL